MDTAKLWSQRARFFWNEIVPHLKYVLSSGLAAFLVILFIVSTHFYAKLLENVPEHFPVNWIAVVCLLPFLAYSPIRTFFKPADLIFLLPAEHRMKAYIQRTMRLSLIVQSVLTFVIWFIVWPLYRVSMGVSVEVFVFILLVLFVMKWTNIYGYWQEQQIQVSSHRKSFALLRWFLTALLLYLLFTFSLFKMSFLIALVLLTYIIALRLPSKYKIHWTHLIEIEKQQRAKYYIFLSWFVDVPEFQRRVSSRQMISRITNLLTFKQSNTYRYLYLKSFIRSDMLGMIVRLALIGSVVIFLLPQNILKAILYLFFIYLIGVQLSALEQQHRYTFWIQVYPLAKKERTQAVGYVILRIHLILAILLFLAIWFTFTIKLYAIYVLVASSLLFIGYHLKLQKKWKGGSHDIL